MKRIYEPAAPEDGFRVLADRLWPRGVKKDGARIDLWAKDITPTPELRRDSHSGRISWQDFTDRYRLELQNNPALSVFIETITDKKNVTLLFAGKDTNHTHVKILMDVLTEKMGKNITPVI